MLIIITGEVNIGKSNIIKAFKAKFKDQCDGFETLEFFENEKRIGFYMKSLFDEIIPEKDNIVAIMDENFNPIVFESVFEDFGVKLCERLFQSKKEILIIDELGVFERECEKFKEKIFNLLTIDKIIIVVLKNKACDFLDKIKENQKIYHITTENRNQVKEFLLSEIEKTLNTRK